MNWESKVWGRVWHLFASEKASVSFLEVEKGFQCSRHFHKERANLFAVVSGRIIVEEWLSSTDRHYIKDLRPGQVYVVNSGIVHRFQVIESGQVIEVYWPDGVVDVDDIERLDEGGKME